MSGAAQQNPAIAEALAHHQAGRFPDAERAYRQILTGDPTNPDASYGLGMLALQSSRATQALPLIRAAVEARPDNAQWLTSLGFVYASLRQTDRAAECYRRATELDPGLAQAWLNLSVALLNLGRAGEAEPAARTAIDRGPAEFPEAHWALARALLTQGHRRQGLAEHEWRLRRANGARAEFAAMATPRWDGSPMPGKSLLVMAEPGFAQNVHALRYVSVAAKRVGRVIVESPGQLAELFATVPGVAESVKLSEPANPAPIPPHDAWIPTLSLAHVLDEESQVPEAVPYLRADPAAVERWRGRTMPSKTSLNVGIAWAVSESFETETAYNMALSSLEPVRLISGVRYYGLVMDELKNPPTWLIHTMAAVTDFVEVAAIIANMDLVIAVDTVIAHIAAAMGKPVWLMLTAAPDWRWSLQGDSSGWYPTVRIFRQKRAGNWRDVVDAVAAALKQLAGAPRPPLT